MNKSNQNKSIISDDISKINALQNLQQSTISTAVSVPNDSLPTPTSSITTPTSTIASTNPDILTHGIKEQFLNNQNLTTTVTKEKDLSKNEPITMIELMRFKHLMMLEFKQELDDFRQKLLAGKENI